MRDDDRGHRGQSRNREGQFHAESDERLEYPIGCKVSTRELRTYSILFDQHRKMFGWQTMSDMYRALLKAGLQNMVKMVKNPARDLITQMEQSEERDKARNEAMRHRELEELFEGLDESVNTLTRAGDLGAIRELLSDFQSRTKRMTDRALKYRRDMEFDRRWGRLWVELNRGAKLPMGGNEDDGD